MLLFLIVCSIFKLCFNIYVTLSERHNRCFIYWHLWFKLGWDDKLLFSPFCSCWNVITFIPFLFHITNTIIDVHSKRWEKYAYRLWHITDSIFKYIGRCSIPPHKWISHRWMITEAISTSIQPPVSERHQAPFSGGKWKCLLEKKKKKSVSKIEAGR